MSWRTILRFLFLATAVTGRAQTSGYPITPVPFTEVSVVDSFWTPRLETNRTVTIPYAFQQCDLTGRLRNFDAADSVLRKVISRGTFCTRYGFDDSDVYKIIEGASYSLHTRYDRALDSYVDSLIDRIARAQEPDGYLYTMRTIDFERSWAKVRWVNDRAKSSHELYNLGHLYEAAVAHAGATGKTSLLTIASKSADLLCDTFGAGKIITVPGHQGIEIGLAKLSLATGKRKYLDLAKAFLDWRGRPKGETYNQDHAPVVEQETAVGHAVRAAYMYSGMADVAALTGDSAYVRAIDRIWDDVVGSKMYVTGGIGAAGNIEGFGPPFLLPNRSAYCETCASIAHVYWNYRMFLRHGDARYLDIAERVMYNAFLSGVSMAGNRFFYPNPLEAAKGKERSPWFGCACCPSNIVRFIPSIPGYMYARRDDTVFVNLYIGGTARVPVGSSPVTFRQEGTYPWQGSIRITVQPQSARTFTVAMRIPGWARGTVAPGGLYRYMDRGDSGYSARVNGKPVAGSLVKGFLRISRRWNPGDTITLALAMPVRRVAARHEVAADRGRVAIERGPLVYCLEGHDNPGLAVLDALIPDDTSFQTAFHPEMLGGVVSIRGQAMKTRRGNAGDAVPDGVGQFTAIPYYAWAHRGPSEMTVWPARTLEAAAMPDSLR